MGNDIIRALPLLIPIVGLMIPIIVILTNHQRKMAELIHSRQQPLPNQNEALLTQEVARLRDLVAQQTMTIDNLAKAQRDLEARLPSPPEAISDRLNQV